MILDLDEVMNAAVQQVLPWEFSIRRGGMVYETLPLTVAQYERLKGLEKMSNEEGYALLGELFADPKPDLRSWQEREVLGAAVAIMTEFRRKNSLAVAQAVTAAISKRA